MWATQFEQTIDDFKTTPKPLTPGTISGPPPVYPIAAVQHPSRGLPSSHGGNNDFYGIFSSNNNPDRSHFPCGVKFQRRERDQQETAGSAG